MLLWKINPSSTRRAEPMSLRTSVDLLITVAMFAIAIHAQPKGPAHGHNSSAGSSVPSMVASPCAALSEVVRR